MPDTNNSTTLRAAVRELAARESDPDLRAWLGRLLADPVPELDLVNVPAELDVPCTPRFGGHDILVTAPAPRPKRTRKATAKTKRRKRKARA